MSLEKFLANLGFDSDPFAKTNADEEERLPDYFIRPPFFSSILGETARPKSAVVFAPRGGGKTALRIMLEKASCVRDDFLCVTYNQFDLTGRKLSEVDLGYHHRSITRLVLVGLLSWIAERGLGGLSDSDRHILYLLVKEHLGAIDRSLLNQAISSVKNVKDKALDFWNSVTQLAGLGLNLIQNILQLVPKPVSSGETEQALGSYLDQLRFMASLAPKLGIKSIYVLIDKVDETALTSAAPNAFKFIRPLLTDLTTLELPGYAFKFFLWDKLAEDYRAASRPDRINSYDIHWTIDQLKEMLSKRLATYSGGQVTTLDQIAASGPHVGLHETCVILAYSSPRNVIRLCKEILDQQAELDPTADKLSDEAISRGVEVFAQKYSSEVLGSQVLRDIKKAKRIDFTVRYLSADVFKVTQQSGLNKVQTWRRTGVVERIGTVQEKRGNKPSDLYGIVNPLVAKYVHADLSIFEFMQKKVRLCPSCGAVVLRDFDLHPGGDRNRCQNCQQEVTV
mgnify:CR=1 FL=1